MKIGYTKTKRRSILRSAVLASLAATSFALLGACQSEDEAADMDAAPAEVAMSTEAMESNVDVADENAEGNTGEADLAAAPPPCAVRCCNGTLHTAPIGAAGHCSSWAHRACVGQHGVNRIRSYGNLIYNNPRC